MEKRALDEMEMAGKDKRMRHDHKISRRMRRLMFPLWGKDADVKGTMRKKCRDVTDEVQNVFLVGALRTLNGIAAVGKMRKSTIK
jgi:hypothetical protein